ncbi:hypothetical protein CERSUDRAFT_127709 [Gelatoporia subvermispora B]|uniref:Uncharacterized protein n=1 Tax=Ceriporiopsis subvermispora (strain B) TaxID=914234 RepID=M2Q246_CERS8|nr:hypothetical protein CERSUDRAFT_127709 [Gelatoporia subvermispora B]
MSHVSSDDILSHTITALKAFQVASSAISAVPLLPAVTVGHNKEQCHRLKERVIQLGNELKEDFEEYRDMVDPSLKVQLSRMLSILDTIKADLDKLSRRGRISSWVHQGSIRTTLDKHLGTTDQISHKYARDMLKTLVKTDLQQVIYTKDHVSAYVRATTLVCDLELGRTREPPTQRDIYSEQQVAEYGGRVVAVRYLCPGKNIESLLRYIKSEGLVVPTNEQVHHHSPECLPSLSVGKDDTFVVTAEDLSQISGWCLEYHLCIAHDESISTDRNSSYDAGSHNMMRILDYATRSTASNCDTGDIYKDCMPQIWSNGWDSASAHAEIGDYGHYDRQLGVFVRLANVFNSLELERRTHWHKWSVEVCNVNTERVWRLVLEPGKAMRRALLCRLYDAEIERSWWIYACSVAESHGIPMEEIRVVELFSHECTASISEDVCDEESCALPAAVYFHWLPTMANGEMPSPFGYWSLEEEASPGPWPNISIPGVELHSRYRELYVFHSV